MYRYPYSTISRGNPSHVLRNPGWETLLYRLVLRMPEPILRLPPYFSRRAAWLNTPNLRRLRHRKNYAVFRN
jgi:hypothetical protein